MADSTTSTRTVAWRRVDGSGLELASLEVSETSSSITGAVVTVQHETTWEIRYWIEADAEGRTRAVRVEWTADDAAGRIELSVNERGQWLRDGTELPDLDDAIDVDLGFSPSTNALPIRRLELGEGESAELVAAWIRFPELDVVPLRQSYERLDLHHYRYRSSTGFERTIEVDEDGLVVDYPGVWARVAAH